MYYLIEITTTTDKINKQIYSYNLRNDAVATFHKKLGNSMEKAEIVDAMFMVIDERGSVIENAYFKQDEA